MKKRRAAKPSVDRKLFTRTASKVKAVNLPGKTYRGGIRF